MAFLLGAWSALAFLLAFCFHYFEKRPAALEPLFFHGVFPTQDYREKFFEDGAAFAGAWALYVGLFAFLARRRGMSFGQALAAMAPGLAGCVFYASFFYADAPWFEGSAQHYAIDRLVPLLALLWPVWRLKLFLGRPEGSGALGPKARGALAAAWWILAGLFAFNAGGHAIAKHRAWANNLTDLGLYVQAVWGWAHGRFLLNTTYALPGDCFMNGEHALLSSALLAPLGWLPDIALGLIVAQSLILLSGAVLAWKLARRHSRLRWAPWLLALLYLASPFLERGWIDDFHIDAMEPPLVLALWLVATSWRGWKRVAMFGLLSLALLGCKEDAGLTYGALGAALLLDRRGRWFGLFALVAGPLATLALIKLIANGRPSVHMANYWALGGSAKEVAKTVFTKPHVVLQHLWEPDRRLSLVRLAFSTGLLCLLAPEALLACGGAVLATLLSNMHLHRQLHTHYGLDFLGPVTLAMILGWARLERRMARSAGLPPEGGGGGEGGEGGEGEEGPSRKREFEWRCAVFALAALALAFSAHREYAKHSAFRPARWVGAYHGEDRLEKFWDKVASRIDPSDGVAAQNHVGSLLAGREVIVGFPPAWGHRAPWDDWRLDPRVDVIVLDAQGEHFDERDLQASLWHVVAREPFVPELYWEGFLLLRRQPGEVRPLTPGEQGMIAEFAGNFLVH